MKKLVFLVLMVTTFAVYAAAQMWCLNETTQCSYGTPSLSKLNQEERNASIYKMTVAKYIEAVQAGTFEAITANELIKRAKAYLAAQEPTDPPDEEPGTPADPALDMSVLQQCANKFGDGCWFGTQKLREFYLLSGNQWEKKDTNGWGTSCDIGSQYGFTSTDITNNDNFSCFVKIDETVNPPTDAECQALGKILNNEGTACVDAPPPDDQMPPTQGFMPQVDFSKVPPPAVGSTTLDIRAAFGVAETVAEGTENGGQFRIQCGYSHILNDDPIVYPNQEGASHNHTFFGNTSVNYASDLNNLDKVGGSTCFGGTANRSAYWTPSLIDTTTNAPLKPQWALFYYKTGKPNQVIAPPTGLRMIAGTSSAQAATGGWREIVRWTCNDVYTGRQESIPACTGKLSKLVAFPECWDGKNLDSPDHKAHMAYSDNGVCPATHPVVIPDITMNVHYQLNGKSSSVFRLASDNYPWDKPGGFSGHADWVNGWNPAVFQTIVNNCLRARKDCHANLLGQGQTLYNWFDEPNATREELK